jgi:GTP-binding protein
MIQAPHVVIIGRPNVGKSTLFNRILGRRKALVHHEPGTTRDRNETVISWKGKKFTLVDTGGWAHDATIFSGPVRDQMEHALAGAELVLLIVDGKTGVHPLDAELAQLARTYNRPTIVVVNKIDSVKEEAKTADFYRLGIPEIVAISANHGLNVFELMDMISARVSERPPAPPEPAPVHIILVGKPNVGKSSLVNALSHAQRSIVHDMPGTTREAIDISIERDGHRFVLIDTPGMHRKRKFTNDMEYLMTLSAHRALERADIAVLVMDMEQGIGDTEMKIAGMILENR